MKTHFCKPGPNYSVQRGFTLIEVMITVAIVGIITAIAVPSYSAFMEKGRRTDAIVFLSEAAGEQFRYFSENNQYAADFKELGYGDSATTLTEEEHYIVSIDQAPGKFTMTATPVTGGAQANDTTCGAFIINSADARTNSVAGANCW